MPVFLLKLAAPSAEGALSDAGRADLESRLLRQFACLAEFITVKIAGDGVVVEFPEETAGSRAEGRIVGSSRSAGKAPRSGRSGRSGRHRRGDRRPPNGSRDRASSPRRSPDSTDNTSGPIPN